MVVVVLSLMVVVAAIAGLSLLHCPFECVTTMMMMMVVVVMVVIKRKE